jgi:predicted DNA-binding transcriptional regulator AlpA
MAYTRYSRPTLARKRRDDPNWPKPIRIGGPGGALRYKAQEVKDWVERQPRV